MKDDIIHQFPERHIHFSAVINLDGLVKLLVDRSNLYAHQNDGEFHTNEQEMRVFSETNYIMSMNKLPTMESYWE